MTVAKQLAAVCVVAVVLVGLVSATALARSTSQQSPLRIVLIGSTPKGQTPLSSRYLNTVIATAKLTFVVKLHNGAARRPVTITLTVPRPRSSLAPIVKAKAVVLRANRIGTVKLGPVAEVMFARRENVKLSVADARTHEVWTTSYPVIFSLG